ncbi:MAG: hypothetical protein MHPSP_000179 [Paramarteilia canceri]
MEGSSLTQEDITISYYGSKSESFGVNMLKSSTKLYLDLKLIRFKVFISGTGLYRLIKHFPFTNHFGPFLPDVPLKKLLLENIESFTENEDTYFIVAANNFDLNDDVESFNSNNELDFFKNDKKKKKEIKKIDFHEEKKKNISGELLEYIKNDFSLNFYLTNIYIGEESNNVFPIKDGIRDRSDSESTEVSFVVSSIESTATIQALYLMEKTNPIEISIDKFNEKYTIKVIDGHIPMYMKINLNGGITNLFFSLVKEKEKENKQYLITSNSGSAHTLINLQFLPDNDYEYQTSTPTFDKTDTEITKPNADDSQNETEFIFKIHENELYKKCSVSKKNEGLGKTFYFSEKNEKLYGGKKHEDEKENNKDSRDNNSSNNNSATKSDEEIANKLVAMSQGKMIQRDQKNNIYLSVKKNENDPKCFNANGDLIVISQQDDGSLLSQTTFNDKKEKRYFLIWVLKHKKAPEIEFDSKKVKLNLASTDQWFGLIKVTNNENREGFVFEIDGEKEYFDEQDFKTDNNIEFYSTKINNVGIFAIKTSQKISESEISNNTKFIKYRLRVSIPNLAFERCSFQIATKFRELKPKRPKIETTIKYCHLTKKICLRKTSNYPEEPICSLYLKEENEFIFYGLDFNLLELEEKKPGVPSISGTKNIFTDGKKISTTEKAGNKSVNILLEAKKDRFGIRKLKWKTKKMINTRINMNMTLLTLSFLSLILLIMYFSGIR